MTSLMVDQTVCFLNCDQHELIRRQHHRLITQKKKSLPKVIGHYVANMYCIEESELSRLDREARQIPTRPLSVTHFPPKALRQPHAVSCYRE